MDATVGASGSEVDRGVGGPGDLQHVVGVRLKGMQFQVDFPDVPESDGLASADVMSR
jgi:hypothetical protein